MLLVFSSQAYAAKIYKWTDDEGKIHYSSTPPIRHNAKAMGRTNHSRGRADNHSNDGPIYRNCTNSNPQELIVGNWYLNKNKDIIFKFFDQWNYNKVTNKAIPKYFIDTAKGNSQSGIWSVKKDILKLSISNIGTGHDSLKAIKKARIHKIDTYNLYLLINNTEAMKFKRDLKSENKPKCMKKKDDEIETNMDKAKDEDEDKDKDKDKDTNKDQI